MSKGAQSPPSRRVLLVSPHAPYPPDFGGAQRTAHLLRALAQHTRADLYLLAPPPIKDQTVLVENHHLKGWFDVRGALLLRLRRRMMTFLSGSAARTMADASRTKAVAEAVRQGPYDTVVLRYSETACQLQALREILPDTLILVDTDDLLASLVEEPEPIAKKFNLLQRAVRSWSVRTTLQRERTALQKVDGLWYTGKLPPWLKDTKKPFAELPNIPWKPAQREPLDPLHKLEYVDVIGVARFTYPPNFQGFDWFLRCVWPLILEGRPAARLCLVGLPPAEPHLARWKSTRGVEVMGLVKDVHAQYQRAQISVAPIFSGGGTKIKVLEALDCGLPCVCSEHAALGYDHLPLQLADDAKAFARACLRLLEDPVSRKARSVDGLTAVKKHHSFESFASKVEDLLTSATRNQANAGACGDHRT